MESAIAPSDYYYHQQALTQQNNIKIATMDKGIRSLRDAPLIACDHVRPNDQCQVGNISYRELEEFHDQFWNCSGTLNKRIFMATYLEVEPTSNPKDVKIQCFCPRSDGSLDIICQKSFMSVLGITKHKIFRIGYAKLKGHEYLYKESRGGSRWRGNKMIYYSNENSNLNLDDDSTVGSNLSDGNLNINKIKSISNEGKQKRNGINSDNNEDDNAMFEPQVKKPKTEICTIDDDEDDDDNDPELLTPVIEIKEKLIEKPEEPIRRPQLFVKKPIPITMPAPPHPIIRKESIYDSPEERIAAREKARAILENLHSQTNRINKRPQLLPPPPQFNQPNINPMNRYNVPPPNPNWQQRVHPLQQNSLNRVSPHPSNYMGPESWQRTMERNIRRRQRQQDVKIDCNHNLTRFCKVISIPHEDLVAFHNAYWDCNGLMEERIFLAKFMVVTRCHHRREMAIATRIPTSDGQLVEVCQKSFLSVVGITKHKVQAAARAKLKGTLHRSDNQSNFQMPRQMTNDFRDASHGIRPNNHGNSQQQRAPKANTTIELNSSDDEKNGIDTESSSNKNYEDSQTGNGDEFEEEEYDLISAEDAFANGKLNYEEFRRNVERNKIHEMYRVQLVKLQSEVNMYKRRSKKLALERKMCMVQITKLQKGKRKLKIKKIKANSINLKVEAKSETNNADINGSEKIEDNDINNTKINSPETNLEDFNHSYNKYDQPKDAYINSDSINDQSMYIEGGANPFLKGLTSTIDQIGRIENS